MSVPPEVQTVLDEERRGLPVSNEIEYVDHRVFDDDVLVLVYRATSAPIDDLGRLESTRVLMVGPEAHTSHIAKSRWIKES